MPVDTAIDDGDQDFWAEQFTLLRSDASLWVTAADEMIRAFETLSPLAEADDEAELSFYLQLSEWRNDGTPRPSHAPPPRLGSATKMVGGYAVELLLKALALSSPQIQEAIQAENKALIRPLWTHKLREIANLSQQSLATDEELLCERLEQFIQWAGRYPCPRDSRDLMPRKISPTTIVPLTWGSQKDYSAIGQLIQRLRQSLPAIDYKQSY